MPYYNCPACMLSVHSRGIAPALSHCPRCLARRRNRVPLYKAAGAEPPTLAVRRTRRDAPPASAPSADPAR